MGHFLAIITIIIWGTTFISTKILLVSFQPIEILFLRFIMGYIALFAICPKILKGTSKKQEMIFAAAGFCGICMYYMLENIALTFTMACNVGVILSTAPFFTALLTKLFFKKEQKLTFSFIMGFILAMIGILLIHSGQNGYQWNSKGDFLAILAAVVWACYTILAMKVSTFGYNNILTTKRIFFYGLIFMLPFLCYFSFHVNVKQFENHINIINLLYLGLGASALCFVTWNIAIKQLGAVKTSVYIYIVPVVTVITSMLILHEKITFLSGIGMILILFGLLLSERKGKTST